MAYLKPQSPLKQGSDYIYPLTTTDQIIDSSTGTRLNALLDNIDGAATAAQTAANEAKTNAAAAQNTADAKAPKSHASTATTYGVGTGSNYGHVKLSDSTSSTSAASAGIAATPSAVKTAYDKAVEAKTAADAKAPIAHSSTATIYGLGNSTNYGHVKLSDAIDSTSSASAGIAASPAAIKAVYDSAIRAVDPSSVIPENNFPTIFNSIYPIGAIYISTNSTNPGTLFGGTWKSVGSGRVLQGVDANHAAGTTVEAGLPEIYGEAITSWGDPSGGGNIYSLGSMTGAFGLKKSRTTALWNVSSNSSTNNNAHYDTITLSANKYNSIYGNSTTVQPPAFIVYIFERTA